MNPIIPTVGRVVYFTPASTSPIICDYKSGVCAALVTAVHNDNCVNLAVFDANGQHYARCSICHVSTVPADDDVKKYDTWDWMPYQKGQAAKTEQLEAKLVGGVGCAEKPICVPAIEDVAEACHEINRSYCQAIGDDSQPTWADAPEWQKSSAINGVKFHLANPDASPSASHDSWLAQKTAEGWVYGEVKDPEKKEHPCCVPYDDLPKEQKAKDYLFKQTVHSFKPFIYEESQVEALSPHNTINS